MMKRTALQLALAGMVGLGIAACHTGPSGEASGPEADVGLRLVPTSRTITQGEVITVAARTENLLGRDAEVKWTAPGGNLTVEQNGRIARVQYDQPATYTVTAQLFVDGREVRRDQTTVRVNPLP